MSDPTIHRDLLHDSQIRLRRIAEAHHKWVDNAGGTFGDCAECGHAWPCPTRQWAGADLFTVSVLCTWDLQDCAFDGHNHTCGGVS